MFYAVNSSSLPEPGTARKTGGTEPRNVTLYKKECDNGSRRFKYLFFNVICVMSH